MNKSILLATIAVLLVAGCTGPSGIQWPIQQVTPTLIGGAGMVIADFSPYQTEVKSGQTDRILVTVSNKGSHSVPDAESLVYLTGSAVNLTTGADQTLYWTSTTETSLIKKLGKEMKPADPINDIPADEKQISWSLKAPNISTREKKDYLFIGRVYYDYQTKVSGDIWIYSDTEADAAKAASKTLNKATFSSTSGPVAITAKLTQDPVVLYSGDNSITLSLKVGSVGGGVLYKKGAISDYSTTNPDNLNLTSEQINRVTIGIKLAGTSLTNDCTGEKELIGGKELPLTCELTVSRPATFQSLPIEITADYGYFVERSAMVTVSGR